MINLEDGQDMYLTDFLYDGVKLSSLGYLVGSAVTSNNESASAGSKLDLQTVMNYGNHINEIINVQYNECISVTFDIIKYACTDTIDTIVEDKEVSYFMRWLNRTTNHKFFPIYNDALFHNIYFNGTFTDISTIQKGGNIVGFTVTFIANTPYGYVDFGEQEFIIASNNDSFTYYDESDEYGMHYPEQVIIQLTNGGDLTLRNLLNNKATIINNCHSGEKITFDCVHKIIKSNQSDIHTTLHKDFNYVFPSICNTEESRENIITSNLSCIIKLIYKPIRKVGIVV